MADVRVQLKLTGLNKLMTSPEVQEQVDAAGRDLAGRAGPDFEYVRGGRHRWTARGFVQPANARGAREQARNAALERALGER